MINKSDRLQRDKVTAGGGRGEGETEREGIGYRAVERETATVMEQKVKGTIRTEEGEKKKGDYHMRQ